MAQYEPQRKETPPGPSPNSPSLLFECQCRSGKFIRLANRIEWNRNFFARIGMLYCRVPVPPPPRRLYLASTLAAWRGVTPSERCRHKRSGERERRPPTVGLRFEIRKIPTAVKKNKFTMLFTIIFAAHFRFLLRPLPSADAEKSL